MIEMMFVLTTVFVAYVVYSIAQEKQKIDNAALLKESVDTAVSEQKQGVAVAVAEEQSEQVAPMAKTSTEPQSVPPSKAKVVPKPQPIEPVKPKAVQTAKTDIRDTPSTNRASVRNPKTAEVATLASNYRFMKRWIKEALVEEGLLEKIYTNKEIDSTMEIQIKEALGKLQELEKYRV